MGVVLLTLVLRMPPRAAWPRHQQRCCTGANRPHSRIVAATWPRQDLLKSQPRPQDSGLDSAT